jgi:hypothetical protein
LMAEMCARSHEVVPELFFSLMYLLFRLVSFSGVLSARLGLA